MNHANNKNNELSELLNEAYQTPRPPEEYAQLLLGDVQKRFNAGRVNVKAGFWKKWLPLAATACVGFATGMWVIHDHTLAKHEEKTRVSTVSEQKLGLGPVFPDSHINFYSPIGNVDGWDVERLNRDGITIEPANNPLVSEDPPLNWVRVTYKCERLGEDIPVIIRGSTQSERGMASKFRVDRKKGEDKLELMFAVGDDFRDQSRLEILIWSAAVNGDLRGYLLSMKRVLELANQAPKKLEPNAKGPMLAQGGVEQSRSAGGVAAGLVSWEIRVGRASLIARTRVLGWEKGIVRHEVTRVLYGDFSDREIMVDGSGMVDASDKSLRDAIEKELGHVPTDAEFEAGVLKRSGIEKGQELILFLIPRPDQDGKKGLYISLGYLSEAPPEYLLADRESTIAQMLVTGDYLSPSFPQPADFLMAHVRDADLIVRAKLTKFDDSQAQWEIIGEIKGKIGKKMLIVDNDLFRLRAEGIVRHSLAVTPPTTLPVERQVADEMKKLIKREQSEGNEAILFLSNVKADGETVRAKLDKRIYENSLQNNLDKAQEAIQAAMEGKLPMNM
jgi:hypothetical protein